MKKTEKPALPALFSLSMLALGPILVENLLIPSFLLNSEWNIELSTVAIYCPPHSYQQQSILILICIK
jgi:hypothetical protein